MAFDGYLKIDGIEGESQDAKHKNEIEVLSYSWGATQSGTMASGGGGGAGKVNMHDFSFTMKHQKSSPKLMLACAQGDHIKSAIFVCRKAGKEQQEFLKVTFTDVLVSSFHSGGSTSGDEIPIDQVTLNFAKLEHEYKEQKQDGTLGGAIKHHYSVKENKGG